AFISPARWFFVLILLMIICEFYISTSILKQDKNMEKFSILDAAHKYVNFAILILVGLVCDEAFGFRVSNFPVLTKLGLQNEISPVGYIVALSLVIYQLQKLDALFKKRYGKSLIEQVTKILPKIISFIRPAEKRISKQK